MLHIQNLSAWHQNQIILQQLNLTLHPGQIHILMGPNGSGKSTLGKSLAGHHDYQTQGQALWQPPHTTSLPPHLPNHQNLDLLQLPPHERANLGLFLSFQNPPTISGVTIANFLQSALQEKSQFYNQNPPSNQEFLNHLKQACQQLQLDPTFYQRSLNQGFSGGERKKNEILQALILQPHILILDEIDSGLDIDSLQIIAQTIQTLLTPTTYILLITHYQRLLNYLPVNQVSLIAHGQIQKEGNQELISEIETHGYQNLLQNPH